MNDYTIEIYETETGKKPYSEWFEELGDYNASIRISTRIHRLKNGSFGDSKFLRDGVSELRIDYGAGYRIYYGMIGKTAVLLLCGGDKRKQNADIERAIQYFIDYKKRH